MVPYGFEPIRLYTSNNTFKPFRINLEISKGAGFVSFSGHGNSFGVSTYPPFSENSINYNYIHIFGQFNFNKLPIVFLFACSTADPDGFSWFKFNFDCFAWSLVKKIFGGAIASIGQTTYGYLDVMDGEIVLGGDLLQLYFFESYEEALRLHYITGNRFFSEKGEVYNPPIRQIQGYKIRHPLEVKTEKILLLDRTTEPFRSVGWHIHEGLKDLVENLDYKAYN